MKAKYVFLFGLLISGAHMQSVSQSLSQAPDRVSRVNELVLVYSNELVSHFNSLTPQERVFIYYMYRASLPGNTIARDQTHRHVPQILEVFEHVLRGSDPLRKAQVSFDVDQFMVDAETYLTYIWTNHGQYFVREQSDEKRTPEKLGLATLTPQNLVQALQVLEYPDAQKVVDTLHDSIFVQEVESTHAVPDSIAKSAVNFYAPDFTEDDFKALDAKAQSTLNAYFYIDKKDGQRVASYQLYSVNGKYANELSVAVHWLKKAHELAQKHPEQFDKHLVKSLEYMIQYLEFGDEELFKAHSIEWLKSNSRIDYVFGFIETYDDPKAYRAIFQSDVTIKSVDIDTLNKILPDIERALPIKKEYMRQTLAGQNVVMPNASINVKAFAAGHLGPFNLTLAYCLPNYAEIRSEHGSKQIIYHAEKSLGEKINPERARRLFNAQEYYDWFEKHDKDEQLMRDIFMLEVILHETLGHGSGRLTEHTFKEGDQLTIEGKTYAVGDTIPVTSSNIQQFLAGYDSILEELRAEIMALLASIVCYDEFAKVGMLKDWPEKVGKEKIIDLSIISMARAGLRRLISQSDNATEVAGAHACANTTIYRYLLEKNAISVIEQSVTLEGEQYTVLDIRLEDRDRAIETIKELANLVQEIKSTGDGQRVRWLIDTYGKVLDQNQLRHMKKNMKAVVGDSKLSATIYPTYLPLFNEAGEIVDIEATWPESFKAACQRDAQLALSTSN